MILNLQTSFSQHITIVNFKQYLISFAVCQAIILINISKYKNGMLYKSYCFNIIFARRDQLMICCPHHLLSGKLLYILAQVQHISQ